MAEFPIMPMHWDAYLGDTLDLTTLEHGAYLLLLASMWRAGGTLPYDEKRLARCAKVTSTQWTRVRAAIMPKLHIMGNVVTQDKLLEVLEAVRRRSQKNSASAKAKWLKHKARPSAVAMQTHCVNDANQIRGNGNLVGSRPASAKGSAGKSPESTIAPIVVSAELAAKYSKKAPSANDEVIDLPAYVGGNWLPTRPGMAKLNPRTEAA